MKAIVLAAAVAALPALANAVTVSPGDAGTGPAYEAVAPGDTFAVDFDITEPLIIDLLFTANGFSGGEDLALSSVSIGDMVTSITPTFIFGGLASGIATLSYTALEDFTLYFTVDESASSSVSFTYSYETSPVPLPASGGLLGLALVGGAVALRKTRKAG